ncbi:hypothetical protein CXG81DRAFT_26770 [Caulochytrium protostelioides]|uniref:Uncharacterized protein n=1 Tax=Caulochytrium protostelioides TaxID=1555241 RepID=A0A4P9X6C1_9FUNG|nr:hypothetical protein CXG81DRAFT_26770 [Caulochytrium protostelioides]|eukprot:RKP00541.1 hypothetical protein CXG81DRAFT_26770 [Caulochytrium protostelioides]
MFRSSTAVALAAAHRGRAAVAVPSAAAAAFSTTPCCGERKPKTHNPWERQTLAPLETWLAKNIELARTNDGPQYLGKGKTKAYPFPMNRTYLPTPPLDAASKKIIYDVWKSDPCAWPVRRVAQQFGISVARCHAILRQQALGETWTTPTYVEPKASASSSVDAEPSESSEPSTVATPASEDFKSASDDAQPELKSASESESASESASYRRELQKQLHENKAKQLVQDALERFKTIYHVRKAKFDTVLQVHLAKGMDSLLRAETHPMATLSLEKIKASRPAKPREPLRYDAQQNTNPIFHLIEETDSMTPETAAMLLRLEPTANVQAKLNHDADAGFDAVLDDKAQTLGARAEPPRDALRIPDAAVVPGKSAFVITDVSNSSQLSVDHFKNPYDPVVAKRMKAAARDHPRVQIRESSGPARHRRLHVPKSLTFSIV